MNILKLQSLFCLLVFIIIEIWPTPKSISRIHTIYIDTTVLDTPVVSQKIIKVDTSEVIKRGEDNIRQLNEATKKGKLLSKSIQIESKKKREIKLIVKTSEPINMYDTISSTPGFHVVGFYADSSGNILSEDSIYVKIVVPDYKKKKPFYIRWFSKNKHYEQ